MIPASDRYVSKNHNGCPDEDAEVPEHLKDLAESTLQSICVWFKVKPEDVANKRQGLRLRLIRKLWLHSLRRHFTETPEIDEDIAAAKAELAPHLEKLRRFEKAAKVHAKLRIPNPSLIAEIASLIAEIEPMQENLRELRKQSRSKNQLLGQFVKGKFDRGGVSDDQADIDRWRKGNAYLYDRIDRIQEAVDLIPGLINEADDLLYELKAEYEEERKDNRRKEDEALASIRAAADLHERSAPALRLVSSTPRKVA